MKRYPLILMLALTGCAATPPPPKDGMDIHVPQARVEACKASGGCALLSQAEVKDLMQQAYEIGAQAAAQAMAEGLDSHGCKRGVT